MSSIHATVNSSCWKNFLLFCPQILTLSCYTVDAFFQLSSNAAFPYNTFQGAPSFCRATLSEIVGILWFCFTPCASWNFFLAFFSSFFFFFWLGAGWAQWWTSCGCMRTLNVDPPIWQVGYCYWLAYVCLSSCKYLYVTRKDISYVTVLLSWLSDFCMLDHCPWLFYFNEVLLLWCSDD